MTAAPPNAPAITQGTQCASVMEVLIVDPMIGPVGAGGALDGGCTGWPAGGGSPSTNPRLVRTSRSCSEVGRSQSRSSSADTRPSGSYARRLRSRGGSVFDVIVHLAGSSRDETPGSPLHE